MRPQPFFAVFVLILAALACSLPFGAPLSSPSASPPPATDAAPTTLPPALPTPTVTTQSPPPLSETDACKLFSTMKACSVLGEMPNPPMSSTSPEYSVCPFFTNSGKGIYVAVTIGDQAKKNFLNEIAQYQKGCSVGYSGGTNTATPFPPEIEVLMSKPLLELYQMDIALQQKCGMQIEPVPEFGQNAYASVSSGMFNMGTVVIISNENAYAFSYADPAMDTAQMVEKAKQVVRAVFLPEPAACSAAPQGSPTQPAAPTSASSAPTSVPAAPTLVPGAPTPVSGIPTPVSGAPTLVPGVPTLVPGAPTPVPGIPTPVPGAPTLVPGVPTPVG